MANKLGGKRVAILIAPVGTEQSEVTEPREAVQQEGAKVDVFGFEAGQAQAMNNDVDKGDTFPVDQVVTDISADDYDALIVPGGAVGSDKLLGNPDIINAGGARSTRGSSPTWGW